MTIRRQPADVVQFTRGSAERISRVVRTVENAVPPGSALTFDRNREFPQRRVFRICTFTGTWSIDTSKTVTFYNVTTTPNTVVATNLHFGVKGSGTIECMIAKDGTAWYLASVNLVKLQSYAAGEIQLLGHDDEGYSRWYSIATCGTATSTP